MKAPKTKTGARRRDRNTLTQEQAAENVKRVTDALYHLQDALQSAKAAGAVKLADRIRAAISSAKGAVRNAEQSITRAYSNEQRANDFDVGAVTRQRVLSMNDVEKLAAMRALGAKWVPGRLPLYPAKMTADQRMAADKLLDSISEGFYNTRCDARRTLRRDAENPGP